MGKVLLPSPLPHQLDVLVDSSRHKVVVCGRRWGKTLLGLLACLEGHGPAGSGYPGALEGATIWWVAPSFPIATQIWADLKHALRGAWTDTRTRPIPNRTGAEIHGEFVGFGIFEERKQIKTPTGDWRGHEIRYEDTGRLALHVVGAAVDGLRSRWGDGKVQRVEGVLASFIIGLERTAVGLRERRLKHERWERERLERLRIEEERREAQALEKRRLEDLDVRVRDFRRGRLIRDFVQTVEAQGDPAPEQADWNAWALAKADQFDARALSGISLNPRPDEAGWRWPK